MAKFRMHLSDYKVIRWFGQRPWLGRRLPIYKRLEGQTRQLFGKTVPDPTAQANYIVALKPIFKGLWEVHADDQVVDIVMDWLLKNVGQQFEADGSKSPDRPTRKRRKTPVTYTVRANQMALKERTRGR